MSSLTSSVKIPSGRRKVETSNRLFTEVNEILRYQNSVVIEKKVFKNLKLFKENKKDNDDLFDRLNTSILNQYLQQLMEGLTAKVFR